MSKRKVTAEQIEDSLAQWCAILSGPTIQPDTVPAGWFTCEQLAGKTGKSLCTTQQRVRRMAAEGLAEKKMFRLKLDNYVRPVPHYRLK